MSLFSMSELLAIEHLGWLWKCITHHEHIKKRPENDSGIVPAMASTKCDMSHSSSLPGWLLSYFILGALAIVVLELLALTS